FASGACVGVSWLGAAASGATPFKTVGVDGSASQAATNPTAAIATAARNMRFCTDVRPPISLYPSPTSVARSAARSPYRWDNSWSRVSIEDREGPRRSHARRLTADLA